jgi:hypothetical protein
MEPGSIDAAIMDGPYELGFMGKKWDSTGIVYDPEFWALVLRVLKPGAHLVNFCATRTYHRMACAVEDAGFEVRNMMQWMFGSSMPKSLDISKAIDGSDARHKQHDRRLRFTRYMREAGILAATINELTGTKMGSHYTSAASQPAIMTREHFEAIRHKLTPQSLPVPTWIEQAIDQRTVESENMKAREVVGTRETGLGTGKGVAAIMGDGPMDITVPLTPEAQQWDGWGTNQKNAFEPIILARKPLSGTVSQNVLAYNTGGLNIDACRVGEKSHANGAASPSGSDIRTSSAHAGAEVLRAGEDTTTRSDTRTHQDTSASNSGATSERDTSTSLSTGESGERRTGRSRKASSSTTSTDKKTTTGSKISNANPAKSTAGNTTGTETNTQTEAASGSIRSDGESAGRWPPNVMISPLMAKRLGDKAKTFPVFDYGDEDRFFYAPKASREEREAGCEHLPGKTQAETVDREPGAPGGNNPRAGAGRENGKGAGVKVRNFHPT